MVSQTLIDIWNSLRQANIWIRIALAFILLLVLISLSFWQKTKLESKLIWSFLRGTIQIVLFGSILSLIFGIRKLWMLYLILFLMCLFAAFTNARSYPYPRLFLIGFIAITSSSIVIMTLVMFSYIIPGFEGIIPLDPDTLELTGEYVIPIGSMVISFAMRVSGIAIERVKSDIIKSKGNIEAALALGDSPYRAIQNILRESYRAGLTPTINRVASLGIVTIPGLMAGMIIGGVPPVEAAIYQIVIFLMLLSASFITSIITNILFTKQFFTKKQQFDIEFLNKIAKLDNQTTGALLKERWKKWREKIKRKKKSVETTD
ncbi:MAG: ABC transporter permease [Candidatus Heimdallarchaeota archaeon]|nr:ABC transporter permease [Candidatus Heimdallarchaeota archaeon]MCK5157679.1 ABC transporter permease [Candidatus Heimdallarchaeota archaeon]